MSKIIDDKRRKLFLFLVCSFSAIIGIIALFIYNYSINSVRELKISVILISIIVTAYIALKKLDSDMLIYRICLLLLCMSLFYSVPNGAGQGTSLYWLYIFPLLFFFFFGKKEGLIWFIIFSFCLFFVILSSSVFGWYSYGNTTVLRFIITYIIVAMIGYGLESSRELSNKLLAENNQVLLQEKQRLEIAIDEIKTLSDLLPICSSCKKIRDDKGYWNQIESYIASHTNAKFSHGICPDCAKRLYPEFYKEK
jgi:hypothetical protein